MQKQLGHSSISITVDIYGHWIPGEGKMDQNSERTKDKAKGTPFCGQAGAGMSSAKFDRMDRIEIIKEIDSVFSWFGQMFGQNSARRTKQKA